MRSSVLNPEQRGVRGKERRKRVDRRTTPTEVMETGVCPFQVSVGVVVSETAVV